MYMVLVCLDTILYTCIWFLCVRVMSYIHVYSFDSKSAEFEYMKPSKDAIDLRQLLAVVKAAGPPRRRKDSSKLHAIHKAAKPLEEKSPYSGEAALHRQCAKAAKPLERNSHKRQSR